MLPQWYFDLAEPEKAVGTSPKIAASQVGKYAKPELLAVPKSASTTPVSAKKVKAQEDTLKVKKAWEIALAPVKALPMNFIMSYFSGSGLQVMTISMTITMFFISPLTQIFDVQQKFSLLEGKNIRSEIMQAKLVFIVCCLAGVAVGVWKVGQMGLLPNHSSDWAAWETPAKYEI